MKKIIAIIATLALTAGTTFAGTVTIEGGHTNGLEGGRDASSMTFSVSESINKTFSVHTQIRSQQSDVTNAVSTRLEVGGTGTVPLFGSVKGYTRVALGQRFSSTGESVYYSIEPGLSMPLSPSLTARVGYRYRTAAENPDVNKDTTNTVRVGMSYALNKQHAVGARFDRQVGDSRQDGYAVFYSRSF